MHSRSRIVPSVAKCNLAIVDDPRHLKTRSCAQRGLFDGLTSFRELEGRISGLAKKGERGDAFEVFAEAYLATVAVEKAKHVWPGANVPHSLRKRLALIKVFAAPGRVQLVEVQFSPSPEQVKRPPVGFRTVSGISRRSASKPLA